MVARLISRLFFGGMALLLCGELGAAAGPEQKIDGNCTFVESPYGSFSFHKDSKLETVDMAAAPMREGLFWYQFPVKLSGALTAKPLVLELNGLQGQLLNVEWDGERLYPPVGATSPHQYLICRKRDLSQGEHSLAILIKNGAPGQGPFLLRPAEINEYWEVALQPNKKTGDYTAKEFPRFFFTFFDRRDYVNPVTLEYRMVVTDKNGKELLQMKQNLNCILRRACHDYDFKKLPEGEYVMNLSLKNEDGEVLKFKRPLKILKK